MITLNELIMKKERLMECRPLTKDERHFKSQIEIVKQFLDLIDEVEESPMSLNR